MRESADFLLNCAIVLAGGNGERLQPFVRELRGDDLPKQYVNFIGTRSMLEHTLDRAKKLIPPERIFTVISKDHLRYPEVRRQLFSPLRGNVVVQPENRDTGPGLFLPLVHLCKRYPDSTVAVFPSDHFILEEDIFMLHVSLAFRAVERDPARIVLLGIKPDEPEMDYGYIVPGPEEPSGICGVVSFVEKPEKQSACELLLRQGLWNTFVMVFHSGTLLDLIGIVFPAYADAFNQISEAIGTREEKKVVQEAYQRMKPVNFSKGLLEVLPGYAYSALCVLPVMDVFWSDCGFGPRLMRTLKKAGYLSRFQRIPERKLFAYSSGVQNHNKSTAIRNENKEEINLSQAGAGKLGPVYPPVPILSGENDLPATESDGCLSL